MKTEKNYKAYIADNKHSVAFDFKLGSTEKSAIAAVKRANKGWRDCCVWCVFVHENGQEEKCMP